MSEIKQNNLIDVNKLSPEERERLIEHLKAESLGVPSNEISSAKFTEEKGKLINDSHEPTIVPVNNVVEFPNSSSASVKLENNFSNQEMKSFLNGVLDGTVSLEQVKIKDPAELTEEINRMQKAA